MESVRCPGCKKPIVPEVEGSLSLPPTGGDYEWCESHETVDCPACGIRLYITIRTWLDGGGSSIEKVEKA